MNSDHRVELFILKCATIESALRHNKSEYSQSGSDSNMYSSEKMSSYINQFEIENRRNAYLMSKHYEIFYMLENDIRKLIVDTMEASHGSNWWHTNVPQTVREEARKNRSREEYAGITARSEDEIDYTTFGQLGEIIKDNWSDFAGMLSNQSAVGRVLASLNMLRGTIAHCGLLAEDEVDRLTLAIRDWFRVLQGPKKT